MSRLADVIVIGGGAIGGSVAWSLAQRGLTVTVADSGVISRIDPLLWAIMCN